MKYLRESNIVSGIRTIEKRKSVLASFKPFTRDIFRQLLLTPHQEMEKVTEAIDNNSFFQSALKTSADFRPVVQATQQASTNLANQPAVTPNIPIIGDAFVPK